MINIVFPFSWSNKSPALKGLISIIEKKGHRYTLFTPNNASFKENKLGTFKAFKPNRIYAACIRLLMSISRRINFLAPALNVLTREMWIRAAKPTLSQEKDLIIIFDFYGCASYLRSAGTVIIFSTEIYNFFHQIGGATQFSNTKIICQSLVRAQYLGYAMSRTYLVPNSYVKAQDFSERKLSQLIYSGSFTPPLGSSILIELFAKDDPCELKLTVQSEMVESEFEHACNVTVNRSFMEEDQLNRYLSRFYVGLVLYDLGSVDVSQKFNFETAPSGKMYRYAACGVPMIGSRCNGLEDIETYGAGILLSSFTSNDVYVAYQTILNNYEKYVSGCKKLVAAANFEGAMSAAFDSIMNPSREIE